MPLSLATWNINSVRLRLPIVLDFLRQYGPDILCLQEIKCRNEQFPARQLADAGYAHQAVHGQKGYHGVAIVSRAPLTDVSSRVFGGIEESRHVSAVVDFGRGPLTVHNFYIPAGGDEPDPEINRKFRHKLDFLAELGNWFAEPGFAAGQLICGDFNIAPHENDVWSHKQLLKVVSHTPVETEALDGLLRGGTAGSTWCAATSRTSTSCTRGGATATATGRPPTAADGSTTSGRPPTSPPARAAPKSSGRRAAGATSRRTTCRCWCASRRPSRASPISRSCRAPARGRPDSPTARPGSCRPPVRPDRDIAAPAS